MENRRQNNSTASIGKNVNLSNCSVIIQAGDQQSAIFDGGTNKNTNTDISPMSNEAGARPKESKKSGCEEGAVQISDDLFMYSNQPLQEGTDVYKGYQLHASGHRRPLAVKRIVPCEDFHLREVQHLLALASHPNVVQIIQSKQHDGVGVRVLFIAMELCSSHNLQGYLDRNRENNISFDFDQTMSFTKQLVSGVKHIHVNKIVHRDLKLENILVSEDGEHIKVSDFGLSKRLRLGKSQTRQTKLGVGTDGYRAPETFQSETIGPSADIFSLGAIIYSIWSNGKHPFGNDVHLVNYNVINNKGRDLSGLQISGTKEIQLHDLIDGMLHPDPKKRPTIEQVAQHPFFKSGPSSTAEDLSNNASSSQQRGMKPSLQKPINDDTLTQRSRPILHRPSATNLPPPTPDKNNRSNMRQQPVEKSSPNRPDNEKTLTQRFQSALRLSSASKKVAPKEGSPSSQTRSPARHSSNSNGRNGENVSAQDPSIVLNYRSKGRAKKCFGRKGSESGCLKHPWEIAVTADDKIVVADSSNNRIQIFDTSGNSLRTFGRYGEANGEFNDPRGICVTTSGQIVVADRRNNRIQVFDNQGRFMSAFGRDKLDRPCSVATNSDGSVFVADNANSIKVFSLNGDLILTFGESWLVFMYRSKFLAVAHDNKVIVSEPAKHRIVVFDESFQLVLKIGTKGDSHGQFKSPGQISGDRHGNILIADNGNHRIQVFDKDGNFIISFGSKGSQPGQMYYPRGVAVLRNGDIVVCDALNHRIQIF